MKVTVCQLSDDRQQFAKDWEALMAHCQHEETGLLLLPEMPFYPWFAHQKEVNEATKQEAIQAHEARLPRFDVLENTVIAYSKPEMRNGKFLNTAYVWSKATGHKSVHSKYFFPEEEGFYEETWFDRATPSHFKVIEINRFKIGFLLCTEIWFTQYARKYGVEGIDFLLSPRATAESSTAQWLRCGQTSAVIGGCYSLSSNRAGTGENGFVWGGSAWVARPEDGELLGVTSADAPFLTLDVNLEHTKLAKQNYPLYVKE